MSSPGVARIVAVIVAGLAVAMMVVAFSGQDDEAVSLGAGDDGPAGGQAPADEETGSDETSPDQAIPDETSPSETSPDETSPDETSAEEAAVDTETSQPVIPNDGPHPGLTDLDGWLQSDVTSLEQLDGKVRVVQFWTFGCYNCQNTIPNLRELYAQHGSGDGDLEIIGVHAPEFDWEAEVPNIEAAAAERGVTWPIALDTRKRNFHDWQPGRTAYWPRTYVLDRDGDIRFDHIGEGRYDELNATVAALLADPTL